MNNHQYPYTPSRSFRIKYTLIILRYNLKKLPIRTLNKIKRTPRRVKEIIFGEENNNPHSQFNIHTKDYRMRMLNNQRQSDFVYNARTKKRI